MGERHNAGRGIRRRRVDPTNAVRPQTGEPELAVGSWEDVGWKGNISRRIGEGLNSSGRRIDAADPTVIDAREPDRPVGSLNDAGRPVDLPGGVGEGIDLTTLERLLTTTAHFAPLSTRTV